MRAETQMLREEESYSSVSEHSPGQISAIVASDTDLNSIIQQEPPEYKAPTNVLNKELRVIQEIDNLKDVKLVRFGIPYVQGEVQSLVPKKEWEEHVLHLEGLLDGAKAENNKLNQIVLDNESVVAKVKNESDKKLFDMKQKVDLLQAENVAHLDKIEKLEEDKENQDRLTKDLINRHKVEVNYLKSLIELHSNKSEELAKELVIKKKENEELILKNSKFMVKIEEMELSNSRTQRQYEDIITRLTEEKRIAVEIAKEQREKLLDSIAENEENVGRYRQYLDKSKELKEKIKKLEVKINQLENNNIELKASVEILNDNINTQKMHNEGLIRKAEKQAESVSEAKSEDVVMPSSSIIAEITHIEHTEHKRSEIHQKQREEVKKTVTQVQLEKDISYQERNILNRQLFEERAKSKELLKDFQMYKLKVKAESEEMQITIKQLQNQIWHKDAELLQLKSEIRSLKTNIEKIKDVRSLNSYIQDLPTSELWLHETNKSSPKSIHYPNTLKRRKSNKEDSTSNKDKGDV